MAIVIKGTGIVNDSTDFQNVVWSGKTKSGKACTITLKNAINKGNIDMAFVEKDDTVAQLVFTGTYDNTDHMVSSESDYEEPWEINYAGGASDTAAGTILLGAGVVSVGGVDVALTRGGSQFTVTREFRNINADGDRGTVQGRVVMDGAEATLTLNALTFLTHMADVLPAISVATSS